MVQIPKRKRGAPKGNRNRLRHGRYSRAARESRIALKARIAALKCRCDHAIALAYALARGQAAYYAALLADAEALAQMPIGTRNARTDQAGKKRVPEVKVFSPDAALPRLGIFIAAKRPMKMVPEEDRNLRLKALLLLYFILKMFCKAPNKAPDSSLNTILII